MLTVFAASFYVVKIFYVKYGSTPTALLSISDFAPTKKICTFAAP